MLPSNPPILQSSSSSLSSSLSIRGFGTLELECNEPCPPSVEVIQIAFRLGDVTLRPCENYHRRLAVPPNDGCESEKGSARKVRPRFFTFALGSNPDTGGTPMIPWPWRRSGPANRARNRSEIVLALEPSNSYSVPFSDEWTKPVWVPSKQRDSKTRSVVGRSLHCSITITRIFVS